jgi:hypothetical protein
MANIFYLENESEDVASDATKMILTSTDQEYGNLMNSSAINVDAIADNECPEVVDKYIGAQLKLRG